MPSAPPSRRGACSRSRSASVVPGVAVVALRRDADPPRPVAARPAAGPARGGPRALAASACSPPCPLLPLRSPFDTSPPGGRMPPLAELGASTVRADQPLAAVDDPGWVTPDPLTSGQDRPEADVDHCQVAVDVERAGRLHLRRPATARPPWPSSATPRPCSGSRPSQEAGRDRGWRIVTYGKSSCAFSDAPATEAGAAYPECDAWNDGGRGRAARRPARRRRDLRRRDERPGRAPARHAGPLVEGYAARWRVARGRRGARRRRRRQPASRPTTSTSAPPGIPASSPAAPSTGGPPSPASGLAVQREAAPPPRVARRVPARPHRAGSARASVCPVVIGHVAVHRAGDHVTATYAATLAPQVGAGGRRRPRPVTGGPARSGRFGRIGPDR